MASSPSRSASTVDFRTVAAAALTIVSWASAFAGIRVALHAYSPAHLAVFRYLVASLVLVVVALLTRMPLPRPADVPRILVLGFVGISYYNIALNYGETIVPAATASFLIASVPIWLALLGTVLFGERLPLIGWLGVLLSFVGVAVIALATGSGLHISPAALIVLSAAFATSIYSIGQKPLLVRYSPIQCTAYAIWAGTLCLLPFGLGLQAQIATAPVAATAAVIYLGILPGALGYLMWSYVLSRLPASRAGTILYLIPATAMLIAWLWLGEIPPALSIAGGILVVTGVVLANSRHLRAQPKALEVEADVAE